MVLQKEPAGAVIWGYGIPEAMVTVRLLHQQDTVMMKGAWVKGKVAQPPFNPVLSCHLLVQRAKRWWHWSQQS